MSACDQTSLTQVDVAFRGTLGSPSLMRSDDNWLLMHSVHHVLCGHYGGVFLTFVDFPVHLTPGAPNTTTGQHDIFTETALLQHTNNTRFISFTGNILQVALSVQVEI